MRKTISWLAVILIILTSALMSACNREPERTIDKDKTQLYIFNYDGGFGSDWINSVIPLFEEHYAETSFEEGKKGVEVIADNETYNLSADQFKNSRDALFFLENVDYYYGIAAGAYRDISDWMAEPISDFNEPSVESKLNSYGESNAAYYQTADGKFYGAPFHEGMCCIIYDIDLFEDKDLYFSKEYDTTKNGTALTSWVGKTGDRSKGPDDEYSTYDDGLPATYDDFFVLLQRMKDKGVIPFTWSGKEIVYTSRVLYSMWADYEGEDQFMLNYNLNDKATDLIDVDANGNITKRSETDINPQNGYLLQKQAGKYHVLKFAERLISDTTNYPQDLAFSGSEAQSNAYSTYLYSKYKGEPIAFLMGGTWWQREANALFETMEVECGAEYSKANRNFGFLPIPKATPEKVGDKQTVPGGLTSVVVANKYITDPAQVMAAKKFFQFIHTEEAMKLFTKSTGCTKPYTYEFEQNELEELPTFTQSMWNIHKYNTIVNPRSNNELVINNYAEFDDLSFGFKSKIDGSTYDFPFTAIYRNKKTAEEIFNGMYTYKQSIWAGL